MNIAVRENGTNGVSTIRISINETVDYRLTKNSIIKFQLWNIRLSNCTSNCKRILF